MAEAVYVGREDEEAISYLLGCCFPQFVPKLMENQINNSCVIFKDILSRVFRIHEFITVFIEDGYVDRIYRDCYYSHYSGKHIEYSRDCRRVFLFSNDCRDAISDYNENELNQNFIGSVVIKPLAVGAIGRTLICPKYLFDDSEKKDTYIRTAQYSVHLRGMKLTVNAFPYSMQDSETLTCAETTLLNIFDYYSKKYPDYKFVMPSDIFFAAKANGYERALPSTGMTYTLMSKIITSFGFYPRLYMKDDLQSALTGDEELLRILSYYVESAIPVAVGIHQEKDRYNHSIVCIGHGKNNVNKMMHKLQRITVNDSEPDDDSMIPAPRRLFIADCANSMEEFIMMDDNYSPYHKYTVTREKQPNDMLSEDIITLNGSQILCLAVPLCKRMYLEAQSARNIVIEALQEDKFSFDKQYKMCFGKEIGTESNPIIMRFFMASSRTFKRQRILCLSDDDISKMLYSVVSLPQFVWVCELYDLTHYQDTKQPIGEIVLDATATAPPIKSTPIDSILLVNYPGKNYIHFRSKVPNEFVESILEDMIVDYDNPNEDNSLFILDEVKLESFKMFDGNLKCTDKLHN